MDQEDYKVYYATVYGTTQGWKSHWREFMDCCTEATPKKSLWGVKKKVDCLAPLPVAACTDEYTHQYYDGAPCSPKQEGKTPMRYNDNYASANACVSTQQSDTSVTRDFLLKELASADYPKEKELQKVFNLYVDNTPKSYKELIDIIKAGTYTIDSKIAKKYEAAELAKDDDDCELYHYGALHGIIWPGPVADWNGYRAAVTDKGKQYAVAKRVIMTGDAKEGLAAIQAFEAWLPTTPATIQ